MIAARSSLLAIAGALFIAPGLNAASDIPGPVAADVERVIDGDTVRVSAKIWVDQRVSVSVRVKGIDAPELFKPQCAAERALAQQAKAFVEALVDDGVLLRDIEHDKYGGRVAARLETHGGADIGAALLAENLATEIGAADPWCG